MQPADILRGAVTPTPLPLHVSPPVAWLFRTAYSANSAHRWRMFLLGFSIANLSEQVVMTAKRMVERVEATPRADGMMIV